MTAEALTGPELVLSAGGEGVALFLAVLIGQKLSVAGCKPNPPEVINALQNTALPAGPALGVRIQLCMVLALSMCGPLWSPTGSSHRV